MLAEAPALDDRALRDPLSVYLVVNGPLGMTAGKIASQAFQAAQRLLDAATQDQRLADLLAQWRKEGTCTITRVAQTPAVFERLMREVPGRAMIDEGLTEVAPGSITCYATYPIRRSQQPRAIRHKKVRLMAP